MTLKFTLRNETPADAGAITEVTAAAFKSLAISQHTEQFVVAALRAAGALTVSIVAEAGGRVIGHIAFSPVVLSDGTPDWYGLGPVSVLPLFQRQGVGRALIREGLERLKAMGARGCCLAGHPGYYAQFGFRNSPDLVLEGVPPEVFFVLSFDGHLPRGTVMFHEGFRADGSDGSEGSGARRRMALVTLRQAIDSDGRQAVHHGFMSPFLAASLVAAALLGGCAGTATTRVTLTPPDQAPVCQPQAALKVSVLWRTQWRADQKDVPEREAAAAQGITRFFADGGCFPSAVVARVDPNVTAFAVPPGSELLLVLTVRELGPTVKLLSSAALVEGGTEVVVDVAVVRPGQREPQQQFSIHWQDGGPGVVKGVQTLPADMAAALKAGLMPR